MKQASWLLTKACLPITPHASSGNNGNSGQTGAGGAVLPCREEGGLGSMRNLTLSFLAAGVKRKSAGCWRWNKPHAHRRQV